MLKENIIKKYNEYIASIEEIEEIIPSVEFTRIAVSETFGMYDIKDKSDFFKLSSRVKKDLKEKLVELGFNKDQIDNFEFELDVIPFELLDLIDKVGSFIYKYKGYTFNKSKYKNLSSLAKKLNVDELDFKNNGQQLLAFSFITFDEVNDDVIKNKTKILKFLIHLMEKQNGIFDFTNIDYISEFSSIFPLPNILKSYYTLILPLFLNYLNEYDESFATQTNETTLKLDINKLKLILDKFQKEC